MRKDRKISKEEKHFLQKYNPRNYEKPSLTSDILLFAMIEGRLNVLLIKRGGHPFKDYWAIPGGFVGINESTEDAAYRELKEETGVSNAYLEQLYTFSEPDRDPRMRVISVAYIALVSPCNLAVKAGDDAVEAKWFKVNELLEELKQKDLLAFDHEDILKVAIDRLRGKVNYTPVAFSLLKEEFTLNEIQTVFEEITNTRLHKPNFRRDMMSKVIATGKKQSKEEINHRPAELYRLNYEYYTEGEKL